jgi:hypothetical protein
MKLFDISGLFKYILKFIRKKRNSLFIHKTYEPQIVYNAPCKLKFKYETDFRNGAGPSFNHLLSHFKHPHQLPSLENL